LHEHPGEQARKKIDDDHAIVDKADIPLVFKLIHQLRERLREQTHQTQITADQIHEKVVAALKQKDAIPEGMNLYEHPIEQVVAMCVSALQCELADCQQSED